MNRPVLNSCYNFGSDGCLGRFWAPWGKALHIVTILLPTATGTVKATFHKHVPKDMFRKIMENQMQTCSLSKILLNIEGELC